MVVRNDRLEKEFIDLESRLGLTDGDPLLWEDQRKKEAGRRLQLERSRGALARLQV